MRENTRTQVHCVTLCSCSPFEMHISLRGARKTISVICTLTISNKTVNFKLFNNVIFVRYAVHRDRLLVVPVAAPEFWFEGIEHETKFHTLIPLKSCTNVLQWRRQNFGSGVHSAKMFQSKTFK